MKYLAVLAVIALVGCQQAQSPKPIPTVIIQSTETTWQATANCPEGWMVDIDHDLYDDKSQEPQTFHREYYVEMAKHLHCRHEFPRELVQRKHWLEMSKRWEGTEIAHYDQFSLRWQGPKAGHP